jgi:hypothetical protein
MEHINSILEKNTTRYIYKRHYCKTEKILKDLSSIDDVFTKGDRVKIFCLNGKRIITTSKDLVITEYMNNSTIYFIDSIKAKSILSKDINLAKLSSARVSVFFSRAGSQMPLHWDSLSNLTIQLSGEKVWHVAPNHFAKYPLVNYSITDAKSTNHHFGGTEPEVKCLEKLKMSKGDILFLPQGFWHMTNTIDSSISVSINFKHRNILNIIDEAVNNSFDKHEIFRIPLDDLTCLTADDRATLHDEIDAILTSQGIL